MTSYTYLLIDLACISIPFIASFYSKHAFYKEWKYFFPANLIVAVFFLIWDYFFTEAGIWGFNPTYLTGIYLTNLPIEEILFFICIPYACTFTYFAFTYLIPRHPFDKIQQYINYFLISILLIVGIFSFGRWYTSLTFILTALYLAYLAYTKVNLSYQYMAYIAILPFFFMSNGLLTGSYLESPIVWYNDMENLGFRLWTIPVEDSMYGLLLIFMNIHLYLYFKHKKSLH